MVVLFLFLEGLAQQGWADGVSLEMKEKAGEIAVRSEIRNVHQLWDTQKIYEPFCI